MAILNHQIVWSHDARASADFLTRLIGFDPPVKLGHFVMDRVSPELTFDFMSTDREIMPQHYAFLVTEDEFDAVFARVRAHGLTYWADPRHLEKGDINRLDDGRGVYFDDPSGHELEIITRPYGSGGLNAEHPNPLLAEELAESGSLPTLDYTGDYRS